MDSVHVVYFLEDRAQERFIQTLVEKIAEEESFSTFDIAHYPVSARGGSRVLGEFRGFAKHARTGRLPDPLLRADTVVVAVDGDCKGWREQAQLLNKCVRTGDSFHGKLVYAIPDPHIERWYLLDQRAFSAALGVEVDYSLPGYKCGKNYYKALLDNAIKQAGISSLLGGYEFAHKIVQGMNLRWMCQQDESFAQFARDLRTQLRDVKRYKYSKPM